MPVSSLFVVLDVRAQGLETSLKKQVCSFCVICTYSVLYLAYNECMLMHHHFLPH